MTFSYCPLLVKSIKRPCIILKYLPSLKTSTPSLITFRLTMSSNSNSRSTASGRPESEQFPVVYRYDPVKDPSFDAKASQNVADFNRSDSTPDSEFYNDPRFVTHIDDGAISALKRYFSTVLPVPRPKTSAVSPGNGGISKACTNVPPHAASVPRILDFCSSWVSHYPSHIEEASAAKCLQVFGLGMNKAELQKNSVLGSGGRIVWDLNERPNMQAALGPLLSSPAASRSNEQSSSLSEDQKLAASTCTVSVDYLVQPVEVLASLRRLTCLGGSVHLAISNRCFPTKAVNRWLRAGEDERLHMSCRDLWAAGWRDVEVVKVTDGKKQAPDGQGGESQFGAGSLTALAKMLGMGGFGSNDPLWVVRGRNLGDAS